MINKEQEEDKKDELADRYYAILEEMLKETINC
jgi:hemerythrin-like domain-containing protein